MNAVRIAIIKFQKLASSNIKEDLELSKVDNKKTRFRRKLRQNYLKTKKTLELIEITDEEIFNHFNIIKYQLYNLGSYIEKNYLSQYIKVSILELENL